MTKGSVPVSGEDAPIETSNRMPLCKIPVGSQIYAIEIHPGKGAQMVRSAGTKAQLMAKKKVTTRKYVCHLAKFAASVLPTAALGVVGNIQHQNVKTGSAGRNRRKGIRPTVLVSL